MQRLPMPSQLLVYIILLPYVNRRKKTHPLLEFSEIFIPDSEETDCLQHATHVERCCFVYRRNISAFFFFSDSRFFSFCVPPPPSPLLSGFVLCCVLSCVCSALHSPIYYCVCCLGIELNPFFLSNDIRTPSVPPDSFSY